MVNFSFLDWTLYLRTRPFCRIHDLLGGLINETMIKGLETDADSLVSHS